MNDRYTWDEARRAIGILKGYIKDPTSVRNKVWGICHNLEGDLTGYKDNPTIPGYAIVSQNCQKWEHYSGCQVFPISGSFHGGSKWTGEELELRISLMKHVIRVLEKELRDDNQPEA